MAGDSGALDSGSNFTLYPINNYTNFMSLIIETGSGVTGANSYATVAQARSYAAARGLVLPTADASVEAALVLACDKLRTYRYKGVKTSQSQPLVWPRFGVYPSGAIEPLADDAIPEDLILAQCQLAYDSTQTELQPTGTGREVLREKVDVLEVQYAAKGTGTVTPQFNKAESLLADLLVTSGFGLKSERA